MTAITIACLLPFVGRAFNIDEPLFLWAARHIQSHPLDFYGFSVNWLDCLRPMRLMMLNPPLVAYYMAAAARIVGWGEVGLHIAFLVPAIAAVLGTYVLARRFCSHPLIAALATLLTPVFLLSGAFFPATGVPGWMKVLVYANPLFYSVDGMRGALIGSSSVPIAIDLGIMFGLSVLLIVLASYMFGKMEK